MSQALLSVVPIVMALIAGALAGRVGGAVLRRLAVRSLSPLIALLLLVAGHAFGAVLASPALPRTLGLAALYAVTTTAGSYLLVALCLPAGRQRAQRMPPTAGASRVVGSAALRGCLQALGLVALGALLSRLPGPTGAVLTRLLPPLDRLVWLLVALIGAELTGLHPGPVWRRRTFWALPVLVVAGSLLGGLAAARVAGQTLATGAALASGFGWFSMSGALVASRLGERLGAVALAADLLRELLGITLLYLSAARLPLASIGACGATALDSTLPFVRQTCMPAMLPAAIFSGLLLTLLGPLLMAFFLGFA